MKKTIKKRIDLEQIRTDTPGLDERVHMLACGAAPSPDPVLRAMTDHLALEASIGGYEAAAAQSEGLDSVYGEVAALAAEQRHDRTVEKAGS